MNSLLALALLVQVPATDTLQVREGLYASFSIGPAVVGLSCDGCSEPTGADLGLQLSGGLGGAVSPNLTIGLQLNAWRHQESDAGITAGSIVASWYPSAAGGQFIRPNIGFASFTGTKIEDGPTEHGNGLIAGLTVGTDLRFDRDLSFTPSLTIQYAGIGDTQMAGLPERSGIGSWMVGIGVGLTWH